MSNIEMNTTASQRNAAMQPSAASNLRLLVSEFCAEVQRQENVLRDLYPTIASAFRVSRAKAPGANDNRVAVKQRPHP